MGNSRICRQIVEEHYLQRGTNCLGDFIPNKPGQICELIRINSIWRKMASCFSIGRPSRSCGEVCRSDNYGAITINRKHHGIAFSCTFLHFLFLQLHCLLTITIISYTMQSGIRKLPHVCCCLVLFALAEFSNRNNAVHLNINTEMFKSPLKQNRIICNLKIRKST